MLSIESSLHFVSGHHSQDQVLLSRSVGTAEMPLLSKGLSAADFHKCARHDVSSIVYCSGEKDVGPRGTSDLRAVQGRPG